MAVVFCGQERAGLLFQKVDQSGDEVLVGWEPLYGLEAAGVEPTGCVVFFEGVAAVGQVTEKTVHGEVEVGIFIVDGGEETVDCDGGVHFFLYFAEEGFFAALTGLDFAAWEFPPAFPWAIAALGGQNGVAATDDGSHNFDVAARLLRGFFFATKKHLGRAVHEDWRFGTFHSVVCSV